MEELIPIVGIISVFGSCIWLVKVITSYFLKRKILDMGVQGDDISKILSDGQSEGKYSSLKWGILVLASGVGLIIINYVPYDADTPFPYGVLAICISLGFLVYYNLVKDK